MQMQTMNNNLRAMPVFSRAVVVCALLCSLTRPVSAANLTWDITSGDGATITGGTGTWTNGAGNWNTGAGDTTWSNANPDTATFGGTAGTVTLGGAITSGGVTFDSAYTVTGNTLTLSTATLTANANATLNSALAGSTTVTKAGTGELLLGGNSPLTGNMLITGGMVRVTTTTNSNAPTSTALGAMNSSARTITVNSGATLRFDAADAIGSYNSNTHATLIADGGTITRISGTTTFNSIGNVELKNGGKIVTTNGNHATLVGSFAINGTVTVSGTSGSFIEPLAGQNTNNYINLGTVGGTTTFNVGTTGDPTADLTVSTVLRDKVLGGAAALTKSGAGRMVLSGANAYTGVTTLSAGTLALGSATAIGTGALTITGGTLDSTVANLVNSNNNTQNWNGNFAFAGTQNLNLGTGAVTMNASRQVTVTANTLTVGGAISGVGFGLTKEGAGTLISAGANTFNGAVVVNGGTLQFNSPRGTGAGAVTVNSGATLTIQNNGSGGYYQPSSLTVSGGTVNGVQASYNRYHGIYTTSIIASGTASITTPVYISQSGATTTETLTIDVATGGTATFGGTILNHPDTSGGLVTKNGGGTLVLNNGALYAGNSSTLNGNMVINAGMVRVNYTANNSNPTATALGNMGTAMTSRTITVNSGATLRFDAPDAIGQYDYASPVKIIADGGVITRISSANTFNSLGAIELKNGAQIITTNGNHPTVGSFAFNGIITVSGTSGSSIERLAGQNTNNYINLGTVGGSTTFDVGSTGDPTADLTVSAVLGDKVLGGAGSLIKTGAGRMILSGGNTYTGSTTVNNGQLVVQNGSALPDLASLTLNNSSQLRLDANESVGSLAGSAASSVSLQGNTIQIGDQLGNATTTYDGVISGTGALIRRGSGTQTLNGSNSFSGSVTVRDGGTLSVPLVAASGNQPLGTGTGSITLDGAGAGATLAITGAGSYNLPSTRGLSLSGTGGILSVTAGTVNMSGSITGNTTFTKAGSGTFNFSGSGSWSGDFTVSGGTFNLTGGGSIPGVGVTTVSGSTLRINTSSLMQTSSLDILAGGTVNLDAGTLRVGGGGLGLTGRSIDNSGGSFNWGNGTLTVYTTGSGEAGLTDRTGAGGSPSGPAVKEGNYLSVAGDVNAAAGSTLDLGSTYLSNGLRYNQLNVSGNLTLNDGSLNIGLSPYFLRPNTPDSVTTGDWGTMVLVYAEGTMSGTFAQLAGKTVIPGISNDGIGWTQLADIEYTGGGSPFDPSTLALNQWLIEYRDGSGGNDFNFTQSPGGVVLLHYKVAGSVPEPASAGLLVAGTLLLRAFRRRRV